MQTRLWPSLAASIAVASSIWAGQATLAQDAKKGVPANPAAATPWGSTVTRDASVAGEEFDKKQLEIIQKVTAYFNQMPDLKGSFVQTSADNKRLRGKFYVKRPGRFRFDYAPPSRMVILSDGQYVIVQDHDIKTDDRRNLEHTPFRVLLRKDVDLLRDARILEVQEVDDIVVLSLQDKNPDNPGRIKLYLVSKPALELREWITTDAQGLDTRVELSELVKVDDLDPGLFKPTPVALQRLP
jgi:outer membrane lipoprotein-sorting protein